MTAIHFRRRFFLLAIRTTPHGRLPPDSLHQSVD